MSRRCPAAAAALIGLGSTLVGCATSQYAPQLIARGELTLRYDGRFEVAAGGQPLTSGLSYPGLADYVRCVPAAAEHARKARQSGQLAIASSVLGGVLGASGLLALGGIYDRPHLGPWIGAGLTGASIGLGFSIVSWGAKNRANGHALDAVNIYNDSVGSLGATCADLRYPAAAGPSQ